MTDLETEIGRLLAKCIGCGKCTKVCPSVKHGGCNPVELMHRNEEMLEYCIGCGNCSKVCNRTDPFRAIQYMTAAAKNLRPPEIYSQTGYCMPAVEGTGNVPAPEWTGNDVFVMPGCVVKCKVPFVENAAADIISALGLGVSEIPDSECCLHPSMFMALGEPERAYRRRNMNESAAGKPIVTLCGGCTEEFARTGIRADHIIHFLFLMKDRLPVTDTVLKVALEPGCSSNHIYSEMKEVVEAMGFETIGNRYGCCGKRVAFGSEMMKENENDCAGADVIAVGCPTCLTKYDAYPDGIPAMHIAELAAFAAGKRDFLKFHKIGLRI